MISRESYIRKVLRNVVKEEVRTLLRSKDNSARFLVREDVDSVERTVDKASDEIVSELIHNLKAKGLLDGRHELSQAEFNLLYKETVRHHFGGSSES